MNLAAALRKAASAGIVLWADGEVLRYSAPTGAMTPELRETLQRNRATVMRLVPAAVGPSEAPGNVADGVITAVTRRATAPRYVVAEGVLPPALIAQIQDYAAGLYVWIPSRATQRRRARDEEIAKRRAAGESITEVAAALGLTARRVCQIQQRDRRAKPTIAPEASS